MTTQPWWREFSAVLTPSLETYVGLVDGATAIDWYDPVLISGLLQTADYFRAHTAPRDDLSDELVDRLIKLKMRLNAVLTRDEPPPPQFHVIIDEAALFRLRASSEVMPGQIAHLIEMAARPNITIQILPFSAGISGSHLGFYSFTLPDPTNPKVVAMDQLSGICFESQPENIGRYTIAFDALKRDALNPEQSVEFLTDLAKDLDAQPARR